MVQKISHDLTVLTSTAAGTVCFMNGFVNLLKSERKFNEHNSVRRRLAKQFGLHTLARKFAEFSKKNYLTIDDILNRQALTNKMVDYVRENYGDDAVNFINQFL